MSEEQAGQEQQEISVDPVELQRLKNKIEEEQNLLKGILAGAVGAVIGAVLWGVITAVTHYQIGFMAIGVGFLVGFLVRLFGRGISTAFGISGAVLSLLGCVAGNLLAITIFVAKEYDISVLTVLSSMDLPLTVDMLKAGFDGMDLVFYGIAVYEGYKISFRGLTEEEVAQFVHVEEKGDTPDEKKTE